MFDLGMSGIYANGVRLDTPRNITVARNNNHVVISGGYGGFNGNGVSLGSVNMSHVNGVGSTDIWGPFRPYNGTIIASKVRINLGELRNGTTTFAPNGSVVKYSEHTSISATRPERKLAPKPKPDAKIGIYTYYEGSNYRISSDFGESCNVVVVAPQIRLDNVYFDDCDVKYSVKQPRLDARSSNDMPMLTVYPRNSVIRIYANSTILGGCKFGRGCSVTFYGKVSGGWTTRNVCKFSII